MSRLIGRRVQPHKWVVENNKGSYKPTGKPTIIEDIVTEAEDGCRYAVAVVIDENGFYKTYPLHALKPIIDDSAWGV